MIRRQFLQWMAITSAGAVTPLEAVAASQGTTLVLQVKGFTCITCAVGLDTLLSKEKGIFSSKSTYPEGKVTVSFDPKSSSEAAIRSFIAEMGFSVASAHKA